MYLRCPFILLVVCVSFVLFCEAKDNISRNGQLRHLLQDSPNKHTTDKAPKLTLPKFFEEFKIINEKKQVWFTYWNGPIDESILICWYYNHQIDDIHQVFFIEDSPDLEIYKEKYPFLNELDIYEFDWHDLLAQTKFEFKPVQIERIINYPPNFKSDLFRYIILFIVDEVCYMDADQLIFNYDKIRNTDFFILGEDGYGINIHISSGVFKVTNLDHIELLRGLLVRDFNPGGLFFTFDTKKWGSIGPAYLNSILIKSNTINEKVEKVTSEFDPFELIEAKEMYTWKWFEGKEFCSTWEEGLKENTGIHLYSKKREKYHNTLVSILQTAIEKNSLDIFCEDLDTNIL